MSVPRRNSRLITVDGDRFRWVVTNSGEPAAGFIVEPEHGRAGRLHAATTPFAVVTASMVAQGIRLARATGWDPHRPGADFRLAQPLWGAPIRTR